MSFRKTSVLRVVVFPPAPPDRVFDYLPPPEPRFRREWIVPGSRVRVSLGRRRGVGVVVKSGVSPSVERDRLRPVEMVLDDLPALPMDLVELLRWTARYYQYPIGRVLHQAVPRLVRRGDALSEGEAPVREAQGAPSSHRLNDEQAAVLERVLDDIGDGSSFVCRLLEGVTGSGKTEIYLRAAEAALARGGQVLVLVPEIGLAPQTVERFRERCGQGELTVSAFHSGMSERERFHVWSHARNGLTQVVIGARSAVFLPFKSLSLIIVDEEHDVSYKQQDTLRYNARDLAVKRAQLLDVPVVLGSATPSLESLCNAASGQYLHHRLQQRAGGAMMPVFEMIDLRGRRCTGGVSDLLADEIRERVALGEQALLFLNRRGYATQVLCHDCGEVVTCANCDVPLVYHRNADAVRCHHCGYSASRPRQCAQCGGADLKDTGMGTERIEEELGLMFPGVGVTRVDADSVRRKGELDRRLAEIRKGGARILIGTQMLSKGHHFPRVTLVGILNVDQRLFAPDFRSLERLGQLVVQVAGRAGRGDAPGKVCLQTHHPNNAHLQHLVRDGYAAFAARLLEERKRAQLPPYHFLALVRAGAGEAETSAAFLEAARKVFEPHAARHGLSLLGPSPMLVEKRGGRYRAQLLLSAAARGALNRCLADTLPDVYVLARSKDFRDVAWHVDLDPVEIE